MIKIIIKQGSITQETADAIVNPANSLGIMGGGVANSIKNVGGAIVEAEAVRQAPIQVGTALITQAGMLPCRFVIHSPTMKHPTEKSTKENIKKAVHSALIAADKHRINSIAMPCMGTGVGGFEPIDAARIMISEIKNFKTSFLKKIILIDISENMINAFKIALADYNAH